MVSSPSKQFLWWYYNILYYSWQPENKGAKIPIFYRNRACQIDGKRSAHLVYQEMLNRF